MQITADRAARLMIFLEESRQWHHRPLFTEIVHRAHEGGMAGASVLRGIEGFGRSKHLHTTRLVSLAGALPCVVLIVDTEEKIREFVAGVGDLLVGAVVVLDTVEVLTASESGLAP